ncbi:MAG: catalase [Ferruginibacter sp.]
MAKKTAPKKEVAEETSKITDLEVNRRYDDGEFLTTNHGVRVNDNQNSLKGGERGATLIEDFILREKIHHFDHERIPERIVHARGSAAHGFFELYKAIPQYTKAALFNDTSAKTPVYVRFSTVAGSRGSSDLARDVRGFAVKFYTAEGNYDIVGNNMPVFFIQDAMKFPDLVHAVKPEPHNEMPQAASAHDTFWDFISLMPESTHMIMWVMSDRAIPRSFRMMEGFGVHTFRFINAEGESHFVKFHWKPLLGVHSVAWDEAQKISGKDPDFHRRDLWEAIEKGVFPEYELGVQIVPQSDEHKFEFDLLDPTKIIPEEIVPVQRIGKLTLNRNPDNFFAETEQVAYNPGHLIPGIDITNDPLLQGRLFSYLDTQLSRLGTHNFQEIPINRPIAPVHNNQRDGHMRQTINTGRVSYEPNTLGGGCPFQAKAKDGGFTTFPERIDGHKIRNRSKSFLDHFSQATLFYNSQSDAEKNHLVDALCFELGKVETMAVRERMIRNLSYVDIDLASRVAVYLGIHIAEAADGLLNHSFPADADPVDYQPLIVKSSLAESPALSMANTIKNTIRSRKIAVLVADGVNEASLLGMKEALESEDATVELIAPKLSKITTVSGLELVPAKSFLTAASVLYDAVYIPGGIASVATLAAEPDAIHFLNETFKHCKPIAADTDAEQVFEKTYFARKLPKEFTEETVLRDGIAMGGNINELSALFIKAIAQHRFWDREKLDNVPA